MKMTKKHIENKMVDDLLEVSKASAPTPSSDLMSRVLADAIVTQTGFATTPARIERPGIWRELFKVLGGWPSMAGLATAAVAGLWLGAFPPGFLPDATGAYLELDEDAFLIDTATGVGFDLSEEAI